MRLLFVGGPKHGQLTQVPDPLPSFVTVIDDRFKAGWYLLSPPPSTVIQTTTYYPYNVRLRVDEVDSRSGKFSIYRRLALVHEELRRESEADIERAGRDAVFHMWMHDDPEEVTQYDRYGYMDRMTTRDHADF